ncbi:Na/Pi cotransporter family protein [Persicirhabdus sediminis]|uniref:Na/Pi cotransporter family protein n=1 Tax=Persicirhabdus sediminis TaxID=454144 RepID=A0A8J7SMH8_9BACT|nr:Na/Pi cotransporter family protein [Persicirhabdus sediminis]MBK1791103.1 Na/Pi cotransporter family protein [Persicirhabdus sediminis]
MDIWSSIATILQILGALGIFLYGMKIMSEGVQKVAGDSMRIALATMTKNRASGIFTGFLTTCMVQSSSATTVLVVSFVNAGLLTLVESISLIMGANLGTTITAWIIAYIGKFSVAKIALPIIGVGLPMFFVGKNKVRSFGETLIGFGLLFLGLDLLKGAVPDLRGGLQGGDDSVAGMIQGVIAAINGYGYGSYVLFMIVGVILTLTVQSSSAAMAITITCAMNGWLGDNAMDAFKLSAAVVLGENIGTTITAWLASIGANVHAKRAARAHFLFNIIGSIWALVLFIPLTNMVWEIASMLPENLKSAKGDFGKSEVAFATAIFHTVFNMLNIFLLVWFVPVIAKTVTKWVKDEGSNGEKPRIQYISQRLVDMGELNLAEAEEAIHNMADHCYDMYKGYIRVFEAPDEDLSDLVTKLKKMEDEADHMMHDITEYLVRCSAREVGMQNAERITHMLRVTAELEESSDSIYRLIKIAERMYNKDHVFKADQIHAIRDLAHAVEKIILHSKTLVLHEVSDAMMNEANTMRAEIKELIKKFNKAAMKRMADNGKVKLEMLNVNTNNHLEMIASHSYHIIESSKQMHIQD